MRTARFPAPSPYLIAVNGSFGQHHPYMGGFKTHSQRIDVCTASAIPYMRMATIGDAGLRIRIIIIKWSVNAYIVQPDPLSALVRKSVLFYQITTIHAAFGTDKYVTLLIENLFSFVLYYKRAHPFLFQAFMSFYLREIAQSPPVSFRNPRVLTAVSFHYPVHVMLVAFNSQFVNGTGKRIDRKPNGIGHIQLVMSEQTN